MSIFAKKQPLSRTDRLKAFRVALYASKAELEISRADFISVLQGLAAEEKMYHAVTAPLESTRPKFFSGNIAEPRTPFRDLAKKIAGTA
jgi:hypothetical protein